MNTKNVLTLSIALVAMAAVAATITIVAVQPVQAENPKGDHGCISGVGGENPSWIQSDGNCFQTKESHPGNNNGNDEEPESDDDNDNGKGND